MTGKYQFAGRWALITGAAAGIGRALALELSARRCNLFLVDVNPAGLQETQRLIGDQAQTRVLTADLTERGAAAAIYAAVASASVNLDLLINNAGVGVFGSFENATPEDFDWVMTINFEAPVRLVRAFLPMLRRSSDAWIVNLSSLLGLVASPGQVAYCSSKFAIRGFSEALACELDGSSVGVSVVHPGGIATDIAQNARTPQGQGVKPTLIEAQRAATQSSLKMPPPRAAQIILAGVEARKSRILVGSDAKMLSLIQRVFPSGYRRMYRKATQRALK